MSYVHKKTGQRYDTLAVALDSTNSRYDEKVVVYWRKSWLSRLAYALLSSKVVFVRELGEFKEKFQWEEKKDNALWARLKTLKRNWTKR